MAETSALYVKQPLAAYMLQPCRLKSSGADSWSPHASGCIVVFGVELCVVQLSVLWLGAEGQLGQQLL